MTPFPTPEQVHERRTKSVGWLMTAVREAIMDELGKAAGPSYTVHLPKMSYADRTIVVEQITQELAMAGWTTSLGVPPHGDDPWLAIRPATQILPAKETQS